MAVSPSGVLSLAQSYLRTTLADCQAFRTFAGAADQAEALARIHLGGLPRPANGTEHTIDELKAYRPYAIIFTADVNGLRRVRTARQVFDSAGMLRIRLRQSVDYIADDGPPSDVNRTFENHVSDIVDDLCDLSGEGGYLDFSRIELSLGVHWPVPELHAAQGCWIGALLTVNWGHV